MANAFYGQGTSGIVLDQVQCVGTEQNLGQCASNPLGLHDCDHTEDAGVRCQGAAQAAGGGEKVLSRCV